MENGIQRASQHLLELEGFLELGMHEDCLRLAKALLKHKTVTPYTFVQVLEAVLIQADDLRCWRRLIEKVHSKFSKKQKRIVATAMFHFYVSLNEFGAAFIYMPLNPRTAPDLLFNMWTLLHLRYSEESKLLFLKVDQLWRRTDCDFERSCLLEAMASYYAQLGKLEFAERLWSESIELDWFQENAWTGLINIQVAKSHAYSLTAQKRIAERKPDWDPMLPRNEEERKTASIKEFGRIKQSLNCVLPEKELWRFGKTTN